LEQTIWTDRAGQTRKTQMAAMNLTTYRTSKEIAHQPARGEYDLGVQTVVRVEPPLNRPHDTRRVVYRVRLQRGDPSNAFAQGETQRIRVLDEHQLEVVVRSLRPGDDLGTDFGSGPPPSSAELASNAVIQCDDPLVESMAHNVALEEGDPWRVALALERHVGQHVSHKSFAQAMASAADVVRSREGDCTEHAVLLAALCRARKIPARVAIGLVYSQQVGGFAYHMWTEVWIKDRWLPVDSTLARGGIGAGHLKVSHSDLQGVDPFGQFLTVFQLIGNLQIAVVSAE
jgi:transglutaminase-like putative cysteine protease